MIDPQSVTDADLQAMTDDRLRGFADNAENEAADRERDAHAEGAARTAELLRHLAASARAELRRRQAQGSYAAAMTG